MTVQKRTDIQKSDLSQAKRALLQERLKGKGKKAAKPTIIPHQTHSGPVPLSYAQERIWFLDQFQPDSTAYNITATLRLMGELNASLLEQSLNRIVDRHEILRTTFSTLRGEASLGTTIFAGIPRVFAA